MSEIKHIVGDRNARPIKIAGSVALVGNSDTLRGSGFGAEIDGFDNVFRFNLCDLDKKYREDVGAKADYCFFSQNIAFRQYPHPPAEQARFISLCKQAKIICYPKQSKNVRRFARSALSMTATIADINRILFLCTAPERIDFSERNHPRNGVKLLACLIEAGIKPTLFGFDDRDRGDNRHYFDNELQLEAEGAGHTPSKEYRLLDILERQGSIVRRLNAGKQ